ncbi:MAG: hypothetical protein ACOCYQ_05105, partial [Alkalispirochaeta sp.]
MDAGEDTRGAAGPGGAAAVGWPVSVFRDSAGPSCVPGLLLPASWRLEGDHLVFSVDGVQPALNPVWVRHVKKRTGLGEDDLLRALQADEEGNALDVVSRRFSNLLARIGGQALRPGDLATEMSLVGEGVRNAAALFLPDEASFTRRVAENLDTIAGWPATRRADCALEALLAPRADLRPAGAGRADVVATDDLTERQFRAADAALSGGVTA